ncbi:MAG: DUF4145 domain-containing protein [Mesorhizobium sp.]|nr:MAG: DUF4145 domain-containing protein [Mesorhizobium sp.]
MPLHCGDEGLMRHTEDSGAFPRRCLDFAETSDGLQRLGIRRYRLRPTALVRGGLGLFIVGQETVSLLQSNTRSVLLQRTLGRDKTLTDITTSIERVSGLKMGNQLRGLRRCPHCSIADPTMVRVWASEGPVPRRDGGMPLHWGTYICVSCGSAIAAYGSDGGNEFYVPEIFPPPKQAHGDVPDIARKFLQQAMDTLHSPDAAAVMAGSAVDAMLKHIGYENGTLYQRIDKALADNVLTKGMADWAHWVRLGSNRPRHADKDTPHVSPEDAKQSVEFAEALANFLHVLTARIDRGIKAASGVAP